MLKVFVREGREKKIDKKKDEARYDNVTLRISRYALEQEPRRGGERKKRLKKKCNVKRVLRLYN